MTVWITGAKGFIGRHLARTLADAGHAVHGIGHGALEDPDKHRFGVQVWLNGEIDATNLNALALRGGAPSTIFHLAGGSSVALSTSQPYEDFFRTVVSTARLLEWLRNSAPECHLIVASSAAVYGADHRGPISEAAETVPMSPYGQHKLMMEQLCQSYAVTFGLRSSVARLFSVYGSHLRKQLLWDLCTRLQKGERTLVLGGTGAEVRDWTEVRDVTRLLAALIELPPLQRFEIINAGSGIGTTVAEVAVAVAKNWGGDITVRFSGAARVGDPFSLVAESVDQRGLRFDWQIPVSRGTADYVTWFKDHVR